MSEVVILEGEGAREVFVVAEDLTCPGAIGGTHHWSFFEGGRGCAFCSAWVPYPPRAETIDPLPTRFPAFHHDDPLYLGKTAAVPDDAMPDLDLEVMNILLPVMSPEATWSEAEQVATTIIELVRARS